MALKKLLSKKHKGILFSLLTIIFIILILGELMTYEILNINYNKLSASSFTSSSSSSLINNVKYSARNFLHQSLFNALNAVIKYEGNPLLRKTNFINNTADSLQSLIINGTLFGTNFAASMNNTILSNFISTTENSAALQNMNLKIINSSITVFQNSPYYISAIYTAILVLNSSIGIIKYPFEVNTSISLNGTVNILSVEQGNPQTITFSKFPNASLIGDTYALNGSMSPFMFAYGTAVVESPGIGCSAVPARFRSNQYILITSNALYINQSVCNMEGVITNITNSSVPPYQKPFLIYKNSFFTSNAIQNGTKILLNGKGLDTLNIQPIKSAIQSSDYFASQYTPDYLDYGQNSQQASQYGIFSFSLLRKLVASFNGKGYINETKPLAWLKNQPPNATFSIWVNPFNSSGVIINQFACINCWRVIAMSIVNNNVYVGIPNTTELVCLSLGSISLNQWTNIAMTYSSSSSGNYLTGYINGKQMNAIKIGGTPWLGTNPNYLALGPGSPPLGAGEWNCGTLASYSGQMSDFQVYNTSLSPYQVSQLYDQGISGIPISSNIVVWYPLQGNANDYSGNNNNGFVSNVLFNFINYSFDPIFGSSIQNQVQSSAIKGFGCNNINNCNPMLFLSNKTIVNEPGYQATTAWNVTAFAYNGLYPFVEEIPSYTSPLEQTGYWNQTNVYNQNSGWDFGTSYYNGNNFFNIPLVPFPYTLNDLNNNSVTSVNGNIITQNYNARALLYLKGTYNFYSNANYVNDMCFLNSKLPIIPGSGGSDKGYCIINETVWNNGGVLTNSIYFQPGLYLGVGGWANTGGPGFSAFLAQPGLLPVYYSPNAATNETSALNMNSTELPGVASFNGKGFINETKPLAWLSYPAQNYTFSIWVNPSNASALILNQYNSSNTLRDSAISLVNDKVIISVAGSSSEVCLPLGNIPLNQWTNIAMTNDVASTGNYLTGYINGKQMNQISYSLGSWPSQPQLRYVLGGVINPNSEWNCGTLASYSGQMSDFQIYNKSLSPYQVSQLYLNNIVPQKQGARAVQTFYQTFYPLSSGLYPPYQNKTLNININFSINYPQNNAQLYGIPGNSAGLCTQSNMIYRTCNVEFTSFK